MDILGWFSVGSNYDLLHPVSNQLQFTLVIVITVLWLVCLVVAAFGLKAVWKELSLWKRVGCVSVFVLYALTIFVIFLTINEIDSYIFKLLNLKLSLSSYSLPSGLVSFFAIWALVYPLIIAGFCLELQKWPRTAFVNALVTHIANIHLFILDITTDCVNDTIPSYIALFYDVFMPVTWIITLTLLIKHIKIRDIFGEWVSLSILVGNIFTLLFWCAYMEQWNWIFTNG